MTSKRHLTLVAAAATLLAAAPISMIFDTLSWLFQSVIAIAMIAGAAWGVRSLRGRLWTQILAMTGALLVAVTMFFGQGTSIIGLIPTPSTFARFQQLFLKSGQDVRTAYVPAPDIDSLLFITILGIGLVAILVDVFAVGMRRPALAGLPMLAIYSVPVAVYAESVSPIPFVIGAIGFMWLLVTDNVDKVRRFGRRFTGEGRGVDIWEPSPLAAAGRRLAAFGVAAAVLLPIVVPGMTEGFFSRFGATGPGGPGDGRFGPGSGSVNLFAHLTGELNQTHIRDLVKVTTNDPSPFYLRFGTADDIQLDGFRNRPPSGKPVTGELQRPLGLSGPGVVSQRYNAKVEVYKAFDMPMVPVYSAPVSTKGLDASWNYDPDQQVVYSHRSRSAGKKFEFDYIHAEYSPDALRSARPLPISNPIQRNLTVVPVELDEIQTLVDGLIAGKTTVYDQVRALYDYFSQKNGFAYDLTVPTGTNGQKILDFLDGKRGFCQQYAAALAWMLRVAKIPARVAFGFTKGSNYSSGAYVLTNRNLHAWTEVYFEGFGWIPFDATPSSSVAGAVNPPWAPNVDAPAESPSTSAPISPGPSSTVEPGEIPRGLEGDCPECNESTGSAETPTPAWVWWTIGGGMLLLIALLMPAWRRRAVRRRRGRLTAAAALLVTEAAPANTMALVDSADGEAARLQAHAAWDELIDTMVDYRLPIDAAETPRATAERLIKHQELETATAGVARQLGHAEERARYAKQPAATADLMAAVMEIRKAIATQASRSVRVFAVLLPPSVVHRWRSRATTIGLKLSRKTADLSLAVRRLTRPLMPRRRLSTR